MDTEVCTSVCVRMEVTRAGVTVVTVSSVPATLTLLATLMTTFVLNTGLGMGLVARLACDKELTTTKLDWRVTEGELEDTMDAL